MTPEHQRLAAARAAVPEWLRWGPYLSERQWGTVREDYSASGDAWNDFPHDHARSRAYRWGEDGLAGISDDRQYLCFALALWNGADPILKERLFGLTNSEGNHGEDVKEYYFYLDATPTHSYMRYLYKYPQSEFPYTEITRQNQLRNRREPEYELMDTGVFADNNYFDIFVEYAKMAPEDIFAVITIVNRADTAADLHLLPTLWFRNTWSSTEGSLQPNLSRAQGPGDVSVVAAIHHELGVYYLYCDRPVPLLFTANETNRERLFGQPNPSRYVKDGINDYVVYGRGDAVNPAMSGTKAAAHYRLTLPSRGSETIGLRLTNLSPAALRSGGGVRGGVKPFAVTFEQTLASRREEADAFYAAVIPPHLDDQRKRVMRQALAGMLWTKQVYIYDVEAWLCEHGIDRIGDSGSAFARNRNWYTLNAHDVLSMPDKWEYPWFASWDLAFHSIPLALVDPKLAKQQLLLIISDRYRNSTGQIPAYEWNFSHVNPPVHGWATRVIYNLDRTSLHTIGDLTFYKKSFMALIANLTWWLNRKDAQGHNLLDGGLLGLDNIGVFDRSAPLPGGGTLKQSDGTSWLAFSAASMLAIAIDLAAGDVAYSECASTFCGLFLRIAASMDRIGPHKERLWDDDDGFFYDVLQLPSGEVIRPKFRSASGLVPLCAVVVYPAPAAGALLSDLVSRAEAFLERYPGVAVSIAPPGTPGVNGRRMFAIVNETRLKRILARLLDPNEFLSPYGIRSVSRQHLDAPCAFSVDGETCSVAYEPGESTTPLFGGNANWRGPIWLPINLLIIDALLTYYTYYGDDVLVECPAGSGRMLTLFAVAEDIAGRLARIFCEDAETGRKPVTGAYAIFDTDPDWRELLLFHEYFHGDSGAGLGASHQTGWTGVIAALIQFFATTTAERTLETGITFPGASPVTATGSPEAAAT